MKSKLASRKIFFACALMVSAFGLHAQTDERQRLIALEKKRFESMVRHDTAVLSTLLGDSLTYIHSSGVIDNKISFLKDIASGRITYLFIYPEKVTAFIDGNNAWIYGRANIRFKLASMIGTIDQYVSFVEVYHLQRYQWQMVICQNARIEKDAPYFNSNASQVISGPMPSIY
jgi:hypothetical protein